MAMRFPPQWLDELRARADIVQVIGQYVQLKKNGRKHWGLCPFHGEKTASFSVDQEQQLFYCFGCKAGGSVIQFIMEMERLEFSEAVKHLADQLHMPLPQMEDDPDYQRRRTQRDRLLEANKEAARFFHQTLFTPGGQNALNYLKRRGLSDNVIRKFGLGAAPAAWDSLTRHMLEKGYTQEELHLVGLTVVKDAEPDVTDPETGEVIKQGRPRRTFDMFRDRAIFPIIDQYGNVLAFGGRALGDVQPKYLNTSDTPVFNKRLGVYAANLLRKERNLKRVILVEGYMDVVSLTQFGVPGVCATLGTALTPEQAKLLKRFAPTVHLAYDGDSAGQHAILRGLDILEAEGIPARVLDFPDKLDPDEFIRRDGREGFDQLPALTPETYRMRRLKGEHDLSTQEGRIEYAKACAVILSKLSPVDREAHLQELSIQTGFTREVLLAQIGLEAPRQAAAEAKRIQQATSPAPNAPVPMVRQNRQSPAETRTHADEELLISLVATGQLERDTASAADFSEPLLRTLFDELQRGTSVPSLVEMQSDDATRARVSKLLMTPMGEDRDQLINMADDCLNRIRLTRVETQINEKTRRLSTASPEEKTELKKQLLELTEYRAQLKKR